MRELAYLRIADVGGNDARRHVRRLGGWLDLFAQGACAESVLAECIATARWYTKARAIWSITEMGRPAGGGARPWRSAQWRWSDCRRAPPFRRLVGLWSRPLADRLPAQPETDQGDLRGSRAGRYLPFQIHDGHKRRRIPRDDSGRHGMTTDRNWLESARGCSQRARIIGQRQSFSTTISSATETWPQARDLASIINSSTTRWRIARWSFQRRRGIASSR